MSDYEHGCFHRYIADVPESAEFLQVSKKERNTFLAEYRTKRQNCADGYGFSVVPVLPLYSGT